VSERAEEDVYWPEGGKLQGETGEIATLLEGEEGSVIHPFSLDHTLYAGQKEKWLLTVPRLPLVTQAIRKISMGRQAMQSEE